MKEAIFFTDYRINEKGEISSIKTGKKLNYRKKKKHLSVRIKEKEYLVWKLVNEFLYDNLLKFEVTSYKDGNNQNLKPGNLIRDNFLEGEKILEIENFKTYYISNYGRVFRLIRGYYRIISQHDTSRGYFGVILYKDKEPYPKKVHRIVAETFIENINNFETVDHIDGNKQNNFVENLQWMTRSENSIKALDGKRKLTEEDALWIKKNKDKYGTRAMAKMLGVKSPNTITNVLKGISFKYVKVTDED